MVDSSPVPAITTSAPLMIVYSVISPGVPGQRVVRTFKRRYDNEMMDRNVLCIEDSLNDGMSMY